jgi:hypothetical protein
MYAEGDCVEIRHESALYIKDALQVLANYFRVESKPQEVEETKMETKRKREAK